MKLVRDPASAAHETYDAVIIGGGIYGAMVSLVASLQGVRTLLVERGDFGGETSHNSLRILHGGLRYLQTLDLPRFFESVGERHWFLRTFPELTESLPCLMPLYGKGARRPPVLKVALTLNDALSRDRNEGIRLDRHLANGLVVSVAEVRDRFPQIDTAGLQGGAVWYDGSMPDSQRIMMETLRWAVHAGATVLNYVEATDVLKGIQGVAGIRAVDRLTGEAYDYRATTVINAAGPWCREVATQFDQDIPDLFNASIAWNALIDRPALSTHALAIAPKKPGARTYFLRPWKGRLLAGTIHDPWLKSVQSRPMPTKEQLDACIDDLNQAIPGLGLSDREVLRIFSGLLPAAEAGTEKLAKREVIYEHKGDGLQGLYSISGVKFTTARLVAEKTLRQAFGKTRPIRAMEPDVMPPDGVGIQRGSVDYHWTPAPGDTTWLDDFSHLVADEAVCHLDDLVLRRTSLGDNPDRAKAIAPQLCTLFDWDDARSKAELERLDAALSFTIPNTQFKPS
jgi:glycerol-3-phosphate dehydrogenase